MSKSTKESHIFALALTVSEIIKFTIIDLQKVGKSHEVQFSYRHHSMVNVKFYKSLSHIFALALAVSEILKFKKFDRQKLDQSHEAQFSL